MHRYLLFFNYRGTNFRGSQKLLSRLETEVLSEKILLEEQKSVQGALETALNFTIKPANKANLFLSSRTDSGVHAFSNSGTVDLLHPEETHYFDPKEITNKLNFYFVKRNLDVRLS